jgi:hypothetical protein
MFTATSVFSVSNRNWCKIRSMFGQQRSATSQSPEAVVEAAEDHPGHS